MLQLILGKAGYGKTTIIRDRIAAEIQNGKKDVLLLVPEQFSFVTGNTFLSFLGEDNYIHLNITDFTRLAREVKETYGGTAQPLLDKGGRAIMMSRAIQSVQDFLKLYKKNLDSVSFINSMLAMYTELKYCDVSPLVLQQAAGRIEKPLLQDKLHDIALVMEAYDAVIADRFIDSADDLTRLYSTLLKTQYLKNRTVYIDGFDGFTAQELKIIERMLVDARSVTVALPAGSMSPTGESYSLFANVQQTANQLIRLAKKNNVSVQTPVVLTKPFRFHTGNLEQIAREFDQTPSVQTAADGSVLIYEAKNYDEECDAVCRQIKRLLRSTNYRCRDIAILSRDIAPYQMPLAHAFKAYGIPYFDDQRQPIDNQPLVNLIRYALRSVNGRFQTDDLMAYAKTGLAGVETADISALENYAILWKINGRKWELNFTNHPSGFTGVFTQQDSALLQQLDETRKQLLLPLLQMSRAVQADSSGEAICRAIYELLLTIKADKYLAQIAKALLEKNMPVLAEEQNRTWDMLMEILDQIVLTVGKEHFTLKAFAAIFEIMISVQDLGNIPEGLDCVLVGAADRSMADNPKIVFLLGANEGVFPRNFSATGLFNDNDRHTLGEMDIELFSDTSRLTVQEKFLTYSALTRGSEALYLSYCTSDRKGNELHPSPVLDRLQMLLSGLLVQTVGDETDLDFIEGEQAAFELLASRWREDSVLIASLKAYFHGKAAYQDAVAAIERQIDAAPVGFNDPAVASKLFRKNLFVSASRAEAYYHCPFLYFCKFGIGAKPRTVAELDPMQTGTVMHYVLEKLLSTYGSDGLLALSDVQQKDAVNQLLEQYLEEEMGMADRSTKRFQYLYLRLQKTIHLVVAHMVEEFTQSAFKPVAYELKIEQDGPIEPMVVPLPDGGSLSIRGSVDRVDVMEKSGKSYLRVIDYKSGTKEFLLSDVLSGLNMQMLIYLFCISQTPNGPYHGMMPSGVLYMPVRRSVSSLPRGTAAQEAKANASKALRMKGLVLNDLTVLKGMEQELGGKYIPVKTGKEIKGSLISAEQLGKLSSKINSLLSEMGQMLHQGQIEMHPVHGKNYEHTCEYCDYQSVCVNKLEKSERIISDLTHEKTLDLLTEEGENA